MKKFIELSSADENNADVSVLVNVEKITYLRVLTEDQNGLQTVIFFGDEHPVSVFEGIYEITDIMNSEEEPQEQ